jgi:cellulose synthase/poly-beta-1,6-N-acetylglucosamine synthase-like glycosyltransferase
METILYIILIFYFTEHLVYFFGMLVNLKKGNAEFSGNTYPFISVIVAARNEENNIGACIDSLLKLDYPPNKLEIIIMNDRSTDKTGEIVKSYLLSNTELVYMEAVETEGRLKGKTRALIQAIEKSKGEIIFTTDADCTVKPSWLKEMVKYYDDRTGVVNSYTIIKPGNIYRGFQSYDWLYLLTIASGADGINNQLSCVGNNMSYRRKAYNEAGGYENIKFSVTEDFMLLKTIRDKTKWKVKYPVNENIVNTTLPCADFRELYRQKKRWGKGGLDIRITGFLVGLIGWSSAIAVLFGWLFVNLQVYLLFVISKLVIDVLFVLIPVIKFKILKLFLYLPFFEIYFALYAFIMPFILLFDRQVIWKEQKL